MSLIDKILLLLYIKVFKFTTRNETRTPRVQGGTMIWLARAIQMNCSSKSPCKSGGKLEQREWKKRPSQSFDTLKVKLIGFAIWPGLSE